jgi:hypothetical protein
MINKNLNIKEQDDSALISFEENSILFSNDRDFLLNLISKVDKNLIIDFSAIRELNSFLIGFIFELAEIREKKECITTFIFKKNYTSEIINTSFKKIKISNRIILKII